MISFMNGFRLLRHFFAIKVISIPSRVSRKDSPKGLPMAKHENSEKKSAANLNDENDLSGLNSLSPWETDKTALKKKLKELDDYQHSLPEQEQKARESIWREGRDQILVLLAEIQAKEDDGGFSSDDDIGTDVPPVKPQTPVAEKPTPAPTKPVEPTTPEPRANRHG